LQINFANRFHHDEIHESVKEAIEAKPKVVTLDLLGTGYLPQDLCLRLWDLLKVQKSTETCLKVSCSANLLDGEVLILLAADEKIIRPYCWMEISSLEKYDSMDFARKPWQSNGGANGEFGSQIAEPFFLTDYRNIFKILNEYLPCESLSESRVEIATTFREFGLLNEKEEEQRFASLFAN